MSKPTFKLTLKGSLGVSRPKQTPKASFDPTPAQSTNTDAIEQSLVTKVDQPSHTPYPADRLLQVIEIVADNLSRAHTVNPLRSLQLLSSQTYDIVTPHLFRRVVIASKTANSLLCFDEDTSPNLWDLPRQMRAARDRGRYFKPECRALRRMVNWWYINELVVESIPFAKMSEDFLLLALRACTDSSAGVNLDQMAEAQTKVDEEVAFLLAMERNKHRLAPNLTTLVLSPQAIQAFTAYPPIARQTFPTLTARERALPSAQALAINPRFNAAPRSFDPDLAEGDNHLANEPFLRALIYASNPINIYLSLPTSGDSLLLVTDTRSPGAIGERRQMLRRERDLLDTISAGRCIGARLANLIDQHGANWWSRLRNLTCSAIEQGNLPNFRGVNHVYQLLPRAEISHSPSPTAVPVNIQGDAGDVIIPPPFVIPNGEEPHARLAQLKTAFDNSIPSSGSLQSRSSFDHSSQVGTWTFVIPGDDSVYDGELGNDRLERQLGEWISGDIDSGGLDLTSELSKVILDSVIFTSSAA